MKNGIIYIATKKHKEANHIKEVLHSAESVKKIHSNLNITLLTNDKNIKSKFFDNIKILPIKTTREKQNLLYKYTPYQNTLYLDTDTEVVNSITQVFSLMNRFDIASVIDHSRVNPERNKLWKQYSNTSNSFPEFAGGVILFRKSLEVEKFFKVWKDNYSKWYKISGKINDQPSFRVSMWECKDLKVYVLPPEFNIRTQEKRDKFNDRIIPKIFHWHDMFNKPKRTPQKI